MPAGYYQQLPKLQNTLLEHYPRIYALAHEAVTYNNHRINIEDTIRLIQTFQAGGVVLTIGELWAFPTMLRLSILDSLTKALAALIRAEAPSVLAGLVITDDSAVGNCIISLRTVAI